MKKTKITKKKVNKALNKNAKINREKKIKEAAKNQYNLDRYIEKFNKDVDKKYYKLEKRNRFPTILYIFALIMIFAYIYTILK